MECLRFAACVMSVAFVVVCVVSAPAVAVIRSVRIVLSLALTSLLARFGLALCASLGVHLRNLLRIGESALSWTLVQCLSNILNVLWAFGQYLVTNVGFLASIGVSLSLWFRFLFRALLVLMVNLICLNCLVVCDML